MNLQFCRSNRREASFQKPGKSAARRTNHGATPTTAMTHIAVQEAKNGKLVEWMEKVADEAYLVGPTP
mgnify:CR=1 FL=1